MYSVLQVADAILKIAKNDSKRLTPLQLMKLVYIAHGFYLAMRHGSDLFQEEIEAWKYGPVIPELYQATKKFGREPIPLDMIGDEPSGISDADMDFLRDVYTKYGHLSGIALSSLTHKPGTPWQQVYDGFFGTEIPDKIIREHYEKIVNGQSTSTASGN
ncbi:type II toxin-antitoxin system antitoxin SocA domain-containing protein [Hoeflea sp. EC-HK425]|uniref:Panacea domain-containing protein n=1 Tax=Hoeflea sp. EC-HK425 TaxID=2038388 RepID=UPI001258A845|nr:type II toxin-antitoxin system antitoxin SocA domain-containing protein [Hoeflea sp. EC-HK425]VVT25175.1 putative phage-associated protein [Hoeflea sp. EC-HK425]